MVRVLYLGLFAAIICALGFAGPVPQYRNLVLCSHSNKRGGDSDLSNNPNITSAGGGTLMLNSLCHRHHSGNQKQNLGLTDDGSVRSERSTNLSHITGSARKIQMFVKNWHLQILPDGIVNGTSDDSSDYTILQRSTVNIGQLKIQGVATCQYLCMDSCGLLYASRDFIDECIFNELIEQHHYNTYSSFRYSNARRTMYLALNRWGQPRRVQIRAKQQLGKLSVYTRVLTKTVNQQRVDDLMSRISNGTTGHPLRHHGGLLTCSAVTEQRNNTNSGDLPGIDRLRCRKRKKRKKKKLKCNKENEEECDVKMLKKNVKSSDINIKKCNNKKCQRLVDKNSDTSVTLNNKKKKKPDNIKSKKTLRNNKRLKNKPPVLSHLIDEDAIPTTTEDLSSTLSIFSIEEDRNINDSSSSLSVEEINVSLEETTTKDDQNYDDGGTVQSSTQPSAEID